MPFLIFATKQDILPALLDAEQKQSVKYVIARPNSDGSTEEYSTAAELPSLGIADGPDALACRRYLVTGRERALHARKITSNDGTVWYAIDQLINPDTIEVAPGGLWHGDVLLSGRVETVSDTPFASRLLQIYRRAIRKRFTRVRAYWVGPEAGVMLDAGARLTAAVQCPRAYDLMRES